jgi:hypothetical protein
MEWTISSFFILLLKMPYKSGRHRRVRTFFLFNRARQVTGLRFGDDLEGSRGTRWRADFRDQR